MSDNRVVAEGDVVRAHQELLEECRKDLLASPRYVGRGKARRLMTAEELLQQIMDSIAV